MLLFQLVWSVVHANVQFEKAKYLYGFFFGFGGVGSLLGALFPGFCAVSFGSENLIFWILPIDLMILVFYVKMTHYSNGESPKVNREKAGGFIHGMQLIRSSRFLIFALAIVVFMQMITAIADFQFNDFLGRAYIEKDRPDRNIQLVFQLSSISSPCFCNLPAPSSSSTGLAFGGPII